MRPAELAGALCVCLAVVCGCSGGSKNHHAEPLKADFTATPTSGVAPLTVQFTDLSTGEPSQWQWDFDSDGQVDDWRRNPQWTYTSPGTYTVTLTVTKGNLSDTEIKQNLSLIHI